MSAARSATQTAAAVRSGEIKAEEAVSLSLAAIDDRNGLLNAVTQVFHERAIERARSVDAAIADGRGDAKPLAGVPVLVKDNITLAWGKTTCASRFLEEYRSPFTATAATKLMDAGAVIVGKTNMDEFAMGSSCEWSALGCTRNPWDHDRSPGGSSGGSAAAAAAGLAPIALGSDTGGSIRQPAHLCGCVGVKPTYGRVSRFGLVAFANSLDQIGPLTTTVADAALCLETICGEDPNDATSSSRPVESLTKDLDTPLEKPRIGIPKGIIGSANDASVNRAVETAAKVFTDAGGEIVEIDLKHKDHGVAAYYIVAPAEASSNLSRFDGVRYGRRAEADTLDEMYVRSRTEGFGPEVRRRIMIGTHVLSSGYYDAYYLRALKTRRLIKQDFDTAFESCDLVLMPTSPGPAFGIGEKINDPLALYVEDVYSVLANLAGLPGVSVPSGFAEGGAHGRLPVGVQLISPAFEEARMLRGARMIEAALDLDLTPPGSAPA